MGIILAFAPFIAFAVLDRFLGSSAGLLAGAVASAILLAKDLFTKGRSPRILEVGTFIMFGSMALYDFLLNPGWSVIGVRLIVDFGLLLIVLITMVVRRPFTLQYARENAPPEMWTRPQFIRTSYVISGAWALAFLVLVLADLLMLYVPEVPIRIGVFITIAALVAAVKFTTWYPARVRARASF